MALLEETHQCVAINQAREYGEDTGHFVHLGAYFSVESNFGIREITSQLHLVQDSAGLE